MHPPPLSPFGTPKRARAPKLTRARSLKGKPILTNHPKTTSLSSNLQMADSDKKIKQRLHSFGKNTAGWRGPCAAPGLWRVALGDLGTERSRTSPPRKRPQKRTNKTTHIACVRQGPQRMCPVTWPAQITIQNRKHEAPCKVADTSPRHRNAQGRFTGGPHLEGDGHRPP